MNPSDKDNPENQFWALNEKDKLIIDNYRYKRWLERNGFFKYYPEGSPAFILIRVVDKIIEEVTEIKIKDFVLKFLCEMGQYEVYQIVTNKPILFKDDILNTLEEKKINFLADTRDCCYIYFKNFAIEIKAKSISTIKYKNLHSFVWRRHIIDFDYKKSDDIVCDFNRFIFNVSGQNERKAFSVRSTIGYLLSGFKSSANNKAIIINDEMISENPNGGTGKGLFVTGISKMKRVEIIDGKTFKVDKSFLYQTVSVDTHIIAFDDAAKNFPFESLFSVITEGITLEKKGKDAIKIPVSKSPKILITTNYTSGSDGHSFTRRKHELEFSQHYNKDLTPLDEFGRLLFDDWDSEEWNKFYTYMIGCVQIYIENGLIESEYTNLLTRKFISKNSFEFYEWTNMADLPDNENRIPLDKEFAKSEEFDKFIYNYPDLRKWFTGKKFHQCLERYAEFHKYTFKSGSRNGVRWAAIYTKNQPKQVQISEIVPEITIGSDAAPF